jgi:hypothetical protein
MGMAIRKYIRDFWHELWTPDSRAWQYTVRILFPCLPALTILSFFAPQGWKDAMANLVWVIPFATWILFILLVIPYRLASKYRKQGTETEEKLNTEIQSITRRIHDLEDERIPRIKVITRSGRRSDNWEHEHLMWAELEVVNTSTNLTLKDVEVRIVNLLDLVEKQDEQGEYILFNLYKWNPIQVYWSERNAPKAQLKQDIPPNDSRIVLIAYSDNSNGPPAVVNTPTSAKPLVFSGKHKIDIEVSSYNSATWRGEFYIECYGKYITKEFPYSTDATFEFEIWDNWLDKKGIANIGLITR